MMMRSRLFVILGILFIVAGIVLLYMPDREGAQTTNQAPPVEGELYENDSYSFRYPATLPEQYIHPVEWPPRLAVIPGQLTCDSETKEFNGRTYCMHVESEGAAGSVYMDYTYSTQLGASHASLSFTLRMTQCGNYDEPERNECERERSTFNPDILADQILQTVELN